MREAPVFNGGDDEIGVADALRRLRAETRPARPLPTAAQLWWRAEVVRRLVGKTGENRRELRAAQWGEVAGIALGLAALLGFLGLQAPALLETLGRRMASGDLLPLALLGLVPVAAASLVGLLLFRRT